MGIKERKIREYEQRKQLILDSAKKIYSRNGFTHITMDDIASEIEFSKGTIYSHFESKEEIYAQILSEQLKALQQFLKEAADNSTGFEDGIRQCLEVYLRFYNDNREYFQLLFFVDLFSNQYRIPKKLLKEIQYQKLACLSQLQRVTQRSPQAQDSSAKGHIARHTALMLWGMLNGLLQLAESKQIRPRDLDPLIRLSFDIVIKGLKES